MRSAMTSLSKEDTINVIFGVFMILLAVVTIVQAARTTSMGTAETNSDRDQGMEMADLPAKS